MALVRTYRALLLAGFQQMAQYRIQSLLWMLFAIIRPVIFLAAWVAIATAQGGAVSGYTVGDFAAYYVCLAWVTQLVMAWNSQEFEWEVNQGRLSAKLLRPLHPIHYSIVDNIVYGLWTGALWEARGILRQAEGEDEQARAMFREAAQAFARTGNQSDAARCLEAAAALSDESVRPEARRPSLRNPRHAR